MVGPCESESVSSAGTWLTTPGEKNENATFLARRRFVLEGQPDRAVIRVSADCRYALSVNGEFVGSGPVKGSHKRYFFDSYDVAALLLEGENFLAAEVHCPGRPTFSAVPVVPALFIGMDGLPDSDEAWEVQADPSCCSDAPIYTPQMGFSEYRDLRRELVGWRTFSDRSADWRPAEVLASAPGGRELVACDIPELVRDRHFPARMVECGTVPLCHGSESFAEVMQAEPHEVRDGVAALSGRTLRFARAAEGDSYAILDFERETFGSVMFEVEAPAGTILDFGYGDALYDGRVKTYSDPYRFADRYILREGRQRVGHTLHDRGFRYLQIVARGFDQPVEISSIEVVQRAFPLPVQAGFECSDPFLNRLWQMCASTLAICATDTLVDCPWREQALWLNDTLVVYPLYLAFTGDRALTARCLRLAADGQWANGAIPSVYPAEEGHNTTFPSMPAIYTIMLADYFLYTGDEALVRELLPVMEKALALYGQWAGPDGLVPDQPDMWNFIDWTSPGSRDQWSPSGSRGDVRPGSMTTILNMLVAAAYKSAAALYSAVGDPSRPAGMEEKMTKLTASLRERFWMAAKGRFCDGTMYPESSSQHPHAVGLHFGLLDQSLRAPALEALLDPSIVRSDFYFQHFVLDALASGGRAGDALETIRAMWGPMVASGSPTVWETTLGKEEFGGAGSLCHAFACTPLYFMQKTVLGIRPLKPGFEEFSIQPQSLGLEYASGTVPTPLGLIRMEWKQEPEGLLLVKVAVPPGTTGILADGMRLAHGNHEILCSRNKDPLVLTYRAAVPGDSEWLFAMKVATMRDYVTAVYGWDDAVQRRMFTERFNPARLRIVQVNGRDAGLLEVEENEDQFFLARIEVLPELQNRGIGSAVIRSILEDAEKRKKSVFLQVLRPNPARALYTRLGFCVCGETETLYKMKKEPAIAI